MQFQVLSSDGAARRGLLKLPHGEVETPAFMPVEAWSEMAERFGTSYMAQSTWLQLVMVTLYYIPTVLLEPFYIGAGSFQTFNFTVRAAR